MYLGIRFGLAGICRGPLLFAPTAALKHLSNQQFFYSVEPSYTSQLLLYYVGLGTRVSAYVPYHS